jgi:hypothetical protein
MGSRRVRFRGGLKAQGPRGMGLGSRNLATHRDEHVALGEGLLFRGFVVLFCRH